MDIKEKIADTIRVLGIDAVDKANSGHIGGILGMAEMATVLWFEFLKHNPGNPRWFNRDRFVLSNGHCSMLLYSLLHLSGYDINISDIENFRQLGAKTAGHPEFDLHLGIETTTGPLGQGIANAVGMAVAEKKLAAEFNRPGFDVVDHHTYTFMGDGCLMEGLSHEACSLAGSFELGKLIAFWDNNETSIDGKVDSWFIDDTAKRFRAYGWHVLDDIDGHDMEAVRGAIELAKEVKDKPSILCCKTEIGKKLFSKAGTGSAHGALDADERKASRDAMDFTFPKFEVPKEIYEATDSSKQGDLHEQKWNELFAEYNKAHPDLAKELQRRIAGEFPDNWQPASEAYVTSAQQSDTAQATRKSSQNALEAYAQVLPEMIGGSADLTGSVLTNWSGSKAFNDEADGNYIYYGVREFGMAAIMNGIALHGGLIPYGGTFLVFSDYARHSIRLSALMGIRSIYVFTHDSIGVGEDGPTHQPIEQISSLRLMPNLNVWRPCDKLEAAVAWKVALENQNKPTVLTFTRQNVGSYRRDEHGVQNVYRGGYVLSECEAQFPDAVIIATGSEVELALQAQKQLLKDGHQVRVVSMPSTDIYEQQDDEYKERILPKAITARVAVEAGSTASWYKYVGLNGAVIGLDRFGTSAPYKEVYEHLGITVNAIVAAVKTAISEELSTCS